MIFDKVTINNSIKLHELGTVEDVLYNNLSNTLLYHDIAEKQSIYRKRKRELKEVTVLLRITDKDTRPETETKIDEVVGLSFSDSPFLFEVNGRFCQAILAEADREMLAKNGLIEFLFINLDGLWYGEEITTTNLTIVNNGKVASERIVFELLPTASPVVLKNGLGDVVTIETKSTTRPVTVNMEDMTIKDGEVHVPIDINSSLFILEKGSNTFTLTNATATIKYREVIAL